MSSSIDHRSADRPAAGPPLTGEISARRVPAHALVYAAGTLLSRSSGLLLIPLYTARLTQGDYGILETLDVSIALLTQLLIVRFDGAMLRSYFDRQPGRSRDRLISTTLLTIAGLTALAWLLLAPLAPAIAAALFRGRADAPFVHLAAAILLLSACGQVPFSVMKAQERSTHFVVLSLGKVALEVALKLYALLMLGSGAAGVLLASLLALAAVTLPPAIALLRTCGAGFDGGELRGLARFAAPTIVSGLCAFALHSADRYMLRWLLPGDGASALAQIGVYGLAYKFGFLAAAFVLDPFAQIWLPFLYSIRDAARRARVMAQGGIWFLAIMTWASLTVASAGPEAIDLLATPQYSASRALVPVIALGYWLWAAASLFLCAFLVIRRPRRLPLLIGGAAVLNIALNALWIPRLGAAGAAWATVASFAALALVAARSAQGALAVAYDWRRITLLLCTALLVYGAATLFESADLRGRILVDGLVVVAYPAILALLRFFPADARGQLRRLLSAGRAPS